MSRVILDADSIQKLIASVQPVEVCDNSGKVFGRFTPQIDRKDWESKTSEAELLRRLEEPGGRALAEILADLESRP
jgi:hypothetical protein